SRSSHTPSPRGHRRTGCCCRGRGCFTHSILLLAWAAQWAAPAAVPTRPLPVGTVERGAVAGAGAASRTRYCSWRGPLNGPRQPQFPHALSPWAPSNGVLLPGPGLLHALDIAPGVG